MHKTLYWLTKDLRIDDNAALIAAAKSDSLLCVYCIEPRWFSQYRYHTASMGRTAGNSFGSVCPTYASR